MDTGQQAGKASHLFLSTGRVDVEIKELRDLQQVGNFLRIHQILGKLTDIKSCTTQNAEADTPNRTKTHLEETGSKSKFPFPKPKRLRPAAKNMFVTYNEML